MNLDSRFPQFNPMSLRREGTGQALYIVMAGALALTLVMPALSAAASHDFAVTSGVDPTGPVHGGGYIAAAAPELFASTSGVDPSGPVHGSGYIAASEQFASTSEVESASRSERVEITAAAAPLI